MLLLSSIVFVLSCVSVLLISMFAGHGWNIMCAHDTCMFFGLNGQYQLSDYLYACVYVKMTTSERWLVFDVPH